jgi:Electron transfer DM13
MTPSTSRRSALTNLFGATFALALVACGGGGSDAASPVAPPGPAPAAPPSAGPAAPPAGACTPVANAKVGKTAALSTLAHMVSGQATIVDSCTIEITNFNYDGGGLTVYVYGGLGGNYKNGFPIGPNLQGTAYKNKTLRVSLKAGDIDKLDGISIWCSDVNADFGNASFAAP